MIGGTNSAVGMIDVENSTYRYLGQFKHNQLSQFTYGRLRTKFIPTATSKKKKSKNNKEIL